MESKVKDNGKTQEDASSDKRTPVVVETIPEIKPPIKEVSQKMKPVVIEASLQGKPSTVASTKSSMVGSGGQMKPSTVGSGGQIKPSTVGSGGQMKPSTVGSGGRIKPSTVGSDGQMKPSTNRSGGQIKPSTNGGGGQTKPSTVGSAGQMKPSILETIITEPYTKFQTQPNTGPQKVVIPKDKVKRPMNAFMCWARGARQEVCALRPRLSNADISVELGRIWAELPADKKQQYFREADLIKEQHRQEHPDWTYRPRPKRRRLDSPATKEGPKKLSLYKQWKLDQAAKMTDARELLYNQPYTDCGIFSPMSVDPGNQPTLQPAQYVMVPEGFVQNVETIHPTGMPQPVDQVYQQACFSRPLLSQQYIGEVPELGQSLERSNRVIRIPAIRANQFGVPQRQYALLSPPPANPPAGIRQPSPNSLVQPAQPSTSGLVQPSPKGRPPSMSTRIAGSIALTSFPQQPTKVVLTSTKLKSDPDDPCGTPKPVPIKARILNISPSLETMQGMDSSPPSQQPHIESTSQQELIRPTPIKPSSETADKNIPQGQIKSIRTQGIKTTINSKTNNSAILQAHVDTRKQLLQTSVKNVTSLPSNAGANVYNIQSFPSRIVNSVTDDRSQALSLSATSKMSDSTATKQVLMDSSKPDNLESTGKTVATTSSVNLLVNRNSIQAAVGHKIVKVKRAGREFNILVPNVPKVNSVQQSFQNRFLVPVSVPAVNVVSKIATTTQNHSIVTSGSISIPVSSAVGASITVKTPQPVTYVGSVRILGSVNGSTVHQSTATQPATVNGKGCDVAVKVVNSAANLSSMSNGLSGKTSSQVPTKAAMDKSSADFISMESSEANNQDLKMQASVSSSTAKTQVKCIRNVNDPNVMHESRPNVNLNAENKSDIPSKNHQSIGLTDNLGSNGPDLNSDNPDGDPSILKETSDGESIALAHHTITTPLVTRQSETRIKSMPILRQFSRVNMQPICNDSGSPFGVQTFTNANRSMALMSSNSQPASQTTPVLLTQQPNMLEHANLAMYQQSSVMNCAGQNMVLSSRRNALNQSRNIPQSYVFVQRAQENSFHSRDVILPSVAQPALKTTGLSSVLSATEITKNYSQNAVQVYPLDLSMPTNRENFSLQKDDCQSDEIKVTNTTMSGNNSDESHSGSVENEAEIIADRHNITTFKFTNGAFENSQITDSNNNVMSDNSEPTFALNMSLGEDHSTDDESKLVINMSSDEIILPIDESAQNVGKKADSDDSVVKNGGAGDSITGGKCPMFDIVTGAQKKGLTPQNDAQTPCLPTNGSGNQGIVKSGAVTSMGLPMTPCSAGMRVRTLSKAITSQPHTGMMQGAWVLPFSPHPYQEQLRQRAQRANERGDSFPMGSGVTQWEVDELQGSSDHDEDIPRHFSPHTNYMLGAGWRQTPPSVPQLDLHRWMQYMNDISPPMADRQYDTPTVVRRQLHNTSTDVHRQQHDRFQAFTQVQPCVLTYSQADI